MRARPYHLLLLLTATLVGARPSHAQKLDKEDKKWLDEVRPLLVREEESVFKKLKDKSDRLEFQKIFWARRDPDLATPENELQAQYLQDRAAADRTYNIPGMSGSNTDCGRVFILLGKPDEVQGESGGITGTLRGPETWTYREKPGRPFQGKASISFDPDCRGAAELVSLLDKIAGTKVVSPSIDYRLGNDGRLTKLVDLLPKDTQARALLKRPRQDYPLQARVFFLKVADGGTALVGFVRGEAGGLTLAEAGGKPAVNVSVAASAQSESGQEAGWAEQTMWAPVGADGAFLGSFKMGLKPGRYTLSAGAVELKSGKGSLHSLPIEVPDFSRVENTPEGATRSVPSASSIMLVSEIEEVPEGTPADPAHPFAAFALGNARLHPFFTNTLRPSDAPSIFYQAYDLTLDASGKGDTLATITLLHEGRTPVAKTQTTIQTAIGGSMIGPVPLTGYAPGKYVVQLKLVDRVGKRDLTQETSFEVKP